MRNGFTTGSCATAAAKAATHMLLFDTIIENIAITTPAGIIYNASIIDIERGSNYVSCAVVKDSGDDPDVTNGALIYARVEQMGLETVDDCSESEQGLSVLIEGGVGVGRVTKPGLDQEVGQAAINHVPREMITEAVTEIAMLADYKGRIKVTISVPEGEKLAMKTFNPRLGIVGGISIIGTSGIVEAMSTKAILDTIRVELSQRRALGFDYVAITPGNYGRDFIFNTYAYDIEKSVKCSNYIGDTIDMASEMGFSRILLAGHIGKLVKLSGGIMNTHSKEADCRMELLAAAAVKRDVSRESILKLFDCIVTEEALKIIDDEGRLEPVMDELMDAIMYHLRKRAAGRAEIECITYSNNFGQLATSKGAKEWLTLLAQEQEQLI